MNTLTLNRILQEGDEYLNGNNGAWQKVPKNDFGLQIQFSTYKKTQVRRPSEKPPKLSTSGPPVKCAGKVKLILEEPISPKPRALNATAAAEKEKTPVPTPSGAGETPHPAIINPERFSPHQIEQMNKEIESLPNPPPIETVVPCFPDKATKAHSQERDREVIDSIPYDQPMTDEEQAALQRECDREKAAPPLKNVPAAEIKAGFSPSNGILKIKFPRGACSEMPIWTGRNGTFHGYGLDAMVIDDRIMLQPIGKRGVGNCAIQFPVSVIPQIIDWLAAQYREKTK